MQYYYDGTAVRKELAEVKAKLVTTEAELAELKAELAEVKEWVHATEPIEEDLDYLAWMEGD